MSRVDKIKAVDGLVDSLDNMVESVIDKHTPDKLAKMGLAKVEITAHELNGLIVLSLAMLEQLGKD